MEHRKITKKDLFLTPEAAQAILTNEMYEKQRKLDDVTVQDYTLKMLNDEFRQGTVIGFCVMDGRRWCVNGQHTLHAIVRSGKAQWVCVETIEVLSLAERAYWYGGFDYNKRRSIKDTFDAYAIEESLNFNKHERDCLSACLPVLATGFSFVPRQQGSMRMYTGNSRLRMAFMEEWVGEAEQFFSAIKGAPSVLCMNIRRSPVMAVALVTYRETGNDAAEFWHAVAMDDGLQVGDPRKALAVFLYTSKAGQYAPHVYSRYIARAWNAAWKDRKIKGLMPLSEHQPIVIEGTRHTGKQILRYITPQGTPLHDPLPYLVDTWQGDMLRKGERHENVKLGAA